MPNVAVFGAYGHTGRFVAAELRDRGFVPILSGRAPEKLRALAAGTGCAVRPASVDDPASLDRSPLGRVTSVRDLPTGRLGGDRELGGGGSSLSGHHPN